MSGVVLLAAALLFPADLSFGEARPGDDGYSNIAASVQIQGTLKPLGPQSLGKLEVTVYAANDTSSTVTSDGSFLLGVNSSDDSLKVRVDALSPTERVFHPALFRAPTTELAAGITVLMVPLQWTIQKGIYAGESVEISMYEVLSSPEPTAGSYWNDRYYQGAYYYRIKSWLPEDRPVSVAIGNETPGYEEITAQDSTGFWEEINEMEETFGRDLFEPATREEIGWTGFDRVVPDIDDGSIAVRVDSSTCTRGGAVAGDLEEDLKWTWPSTPVELWESFPQPTTPAAPWQPPPPERFRASGRALSTGLVEFCHQSFPAAPLIKHEMGHGMGLGHGCRIPGTMTYPCDSDLNRWPRKGSYTSYDVAYWELRDELFRMAEKHDTRFGILPALFGERALMRGLKPVPSEQEWDKVAFRNAGAAESIEFGDTGVRVVLKIDRGETALMWTSRHDEAPLSPEGISESNVGERRVVIEKQNFTLDSDLDIGSDTEVRVDVGVLSGIENPANVTVYRRPARATAPFEKLETTYDAQSNELVAKTNRFGEFAFASDTEPLPVELAAFEASASGQEVRLTWQTASETENAGFRVQRRAGQQDGWTKVGFVEGAGTTSQPTSYRYVDSGLPYAADTLSYRLQQVDTDGSAHFSDPVTVSRGGISELQLKETYPNPARRQVTVRYGVPEAVAGQVSLRLYDLLGREVRTVAAESEGGRHEAQLKVGDLASGVYVLRLQAEGALRTQKLTVVR